MGFFSKLKQKAQEVSQADALVLAHKQYAPHVLASKASGEAARDSVRNAGFGLGVGGVLSLVGVGAACQAGVLGGPAVLVGASKAVAALGAASVFGAAIPVATVAALGVAVAGVSALAVSAVMKPDFGKGVEFQRAVANNDLATVSRIASKNISIGSWIKGAGKTVFGAINEMISSKASSLGKAGVLSAGVLAVSNQVNAEQMPKVAVDPTSIQLSVGSTADSRLDQEYSTSIEQSFQELMAQGGVFVEPKSVEVPNQAMLREHEAPSMTM